VRSVQVAPDRRLVTVTSETPAPGPEQALIEVAACGICGSDLHFRDVPELFPAGTVPGHELSGRIASVGEAVKEWSVGDRVCVLPFAQCGECDLCRSGNEQVCPDAVRKGVGLGTGRPGGYADKVIVDQRMVFALPDEVDDRAGTLVEPLAVAVRAVAQAAVAPDEPVVVLGAGPIGLLTALMLRERGYRQATIHSRNDSRAQLARHLGLDAVTLPQLRSATAEHPATCVFDCAGTPSSARLGVEVLRPLGQLMLVGMSLSPLDLQAPPMIIKELSVRGVIAYRRSEFAEAIDLLARGRIPVGQLITDTMSLEHAESAFGVLTKPGNRHLKIILMP
jgi:2-desacetyl-2-hydroxyethyl bacteriochlorophyllide A dehydrogenase